jgi:hypothetical protein
LHRPVGESIPILQNAKYGSGPKIEFTPPANAISESPFRKLWQARCTATNADEHAVSTATLGPFKFKTYDTRFATMLCTDPVAI